MVYEATRPPNILPCSQTMVRYRHGPYITRHELHDTPSWRAAILPEKTSWTVYWKMLLKKILNSCVLYLRLRFSIAQACIDDKFIVLNYILCYCLLIFQQWTQSEKNAFQGVPGQERIVPAILECFAINVRNGKTKKKKTICFPRLVLDHFTVLFNGFILIFIIT